MLSQVRFNLQTKLAKRHVIVDNCSSLGKENFRHFSRRIILTYCVIQTLLQNEEMSALNSI